ncbi:hypothetical protein SAMN05216298_5157 [Glycomyces sambucus]|uniref:Lipoprotein n=1 Tax=Glycomyces sambucus TaxID=380244 RepID=A0A1G9MSQ8_9ACTN|nr:hypothetical protein [Glycomyces sambucus]SDL77249.1 hypothetical protein SAMN05216298_5157 [Glycomyces sambucus]
MRTRTSVRLAGVAAVAAFGLGLAACGDGENDTAGGGTGDGGDNAVALSPQEAVAAAFQGLSDDSYKMESTMTLDGAEFVTMTTVVDGDNAQSTGDILMSAMAGASGEEMEPGLAELFGDMHTETILVGETAYIQITGGMFDGLTEEYGEDVWFTADVTEGDMAEVYSQFGGMDLASQTENMLASLENVEETGDNTYTGTLAADSEALSAFTEGATAADTAALESIEVTVALDDDGLLETMSMTLPETEGMTMVMTSEVVEIGGSYDITAPASENLVPFEEFMGSGL